MLNKNDQYSYKELQLYSSRSTPVAINIDYLYTSSPEERVSCVRRAIDYLALEFTKSRQLKQNRTEDELTGEIIISLKCMGFEASHDTQYGGHCDIVVEAAQGFLWIAEAKIHRDYDWLLKGYNQLLTRYSTGQKGQDNGDMIIYVYIQNVNHVMNKWNAYLIENEKDVITENCPDSSFNFFSTQMHQNTGLPFTTRHVPISLYFSPQDK